MVTLQLVGPKGEIEQIGRQAKMQTHLRARAFVVHQWISVLQCVHLLYEHDPKLQLDQFPSFKRFVSKCNEGIMNNAIRITNVSARNAEIVIGDDISQVRTGIIQQGDINAMESNETDMNISGTMISNNSLMGIQAQQDTANPNKNLNNEAQNYLDYIVKTAEAFNVSIPRNPTENSDTETSQRKKRRKKKQEHHNPSDFQHIRHAAFLSSREEEPINEFEDMHDLLVGAFPQIFLMGASYSTRTALPNNKEIEHLLLQYTNLAATCRELLFYLFDCKSRHSVLSNLAFRIKKDPVAFQTYAQLVRNDDFKQKIIFAAKNPTSDTAKEILRIVTPILHFGSRQSITGGLGDSTSLLRAVAMTQRYGPSFTLLTYTPDDVNHPTSLRMTIHKVDNCKIPAVVLNLELSVQRKKKKAKQEP